VLAPQKKHRRQLEKNLVEKKQLYDSALSASQEDAKSELNRRVEDLKDGLRGFVTDFEDSANLTFDISRIANEKKVGSFSVKAADVHRGNDIPNCSHIAENRINVTFTAGFNQFASFLNALERNSPVIFVDEFVITRSKHTDEVNQASMNLAVLVTKRQDG
jgi:hypothetical protein